MCNHHHHTGTKATATLEKPHSRSTAALPPVPKPANVLQNQSKEVHTGHKVVASLGENNFPQRSSRPLPPMLPTKAKATVPTTAPVNQIQTTRPTAAAIPAALPAASLAMVSAVESALSSAFEARKALSSAPGGISNNGEKRWQAALLETIFKAVLPAENTRPDMFDGPKKTQMISAALAKLKQLQFDLTKLPTFMGGQRRA